MSGHCLYGICPDLTTLNKMKIREFTKDIFYTGVDDRVTDRFEGLWPLPYGVSYNSYVVAGSEKTALIDTVSISEVREYLSNVSEIANNGKIDYLVVNHMEPDHSGSIPEVVKSYPEIKIISNSQTVDMIKGFYHIDDDARFLVIKDGEEVSLGNLTLKFYLTPMVHWPETMMTFIPEKKVLFSGDAFGSFGALEGAVVDCEANVGIYIREMYRYYSNIVGKYGKFVERALSKLSGLQFDYICSTHGPVWHEHIAEVVGIVSRLAAYKSEPGVTIVYGSMYGNTAEVADMIARELSRQGVRNIHMHNASHSSMSDMVTDGFRYQTLIVGSATYSMRLFPPVETFMNAMETREIKNKVFASFGNYTWAKGIVVAKLKEYADRIGLPVSASMMVKQSASSVTEHEVREFVTNIVKAIENQKD